MEDEKIDPQIESEVEERLKAKNRYDKLSEKVILTSKEKDEALALAKANADKADVISKERDFYKDFSANVTKYPAASEYQDQVLQKVKSGYSTEDAMVSVLASLGKLSSQPMAQTNVQIEGGSAPTVSPGNKSLNEMSIAEKLQALTEADKNGDLVNALRG